MKKIYIIVIVIFVLSSAIVIRNVIPSQQQASVVPTVVPVQQMHDTYTYKGQSGKDALSLLQATTKIALDKSGMVAVINGRKAEASKKEYWAFYINGKMAQVGPKDYITQDTDTIEWKIATY